MPLPPSLSPHSLAFALSGAATALGQVRQGVSLPAALRQLAAPSPQARGAIQDLAYRTMRNLGRADTLIAHLIPQPPAAPVRDLLAVALGLLAAPGPAAYAAHTIVSQAVHAAAADAATVYAKGMVNAVLRRFLREQTHWLAKLNHNMLARWSHPTWWMAAVQRAYPEHWESVLQTGNNHPAMTLRVNTQQQSLAHYLDRLAQQGIAAEAVGPQAIRLERPLPVAAIPGFTAGEVSVQDAGAQLAAPLLAPANGMRVLDACAAPGGKTCHLLELAPEAQVLALEADAARAERIHDNLRRLGIMATVQIGDAGHPATWWDGRPFDRILADVPCSASGIVRRHPDIRWLRRESDLAQLQAEQRRILQALWPLLAPGGKFLYVTCSIFPEEGETQANWLQTTFADAERLPAPGQLLPTTGPGVDHDGFFYALFQKNAG